MAQSSNRSKKGGSTKRVSQKQRQIEQYKKDQMNRILTFAIICLVLLLFFLANFGIIGSIGDAISSFFFGLFGSLWWILPLAGMGISYIAIIKPDTRKNTLRLVASGTLYFSLAWLVALIQEKWDTEIDFIAAYQLGALEKKGGILALGLGSAIAKFIGNAGAGILCVVLILASIVFVIGIDRVLDLWEKYNDYMDSDERQEKLERRREMREREAAREEERYLKESEEREERRVQREEKRRLRMENVASGVSFDDTTVKSGSVPAPAPMQNLQEVNEEELRRRALAREEEEKRLKELGAGAAVAASAGLGAASAASAGVMVQTVTSGSVDNSNSPFSASGISGMESRVVQPSGYGVTNANNEFEYTSKGFVYQTPDEKFMRQQRELERAKRNQQDLAANVQDIMGITIEEPSEPAINIMPSEYAPEAEVISSQNEAEYTVKNEIADDYVAPVQNEIADDYVAPVQQEAEEVQPVMPEAAPAVPAAPKKPKPRPYVFPPIDLLDAPKAVSGGDSAEENRSVCDKLEKTLNNFGVSAKVTNYTVGPTVTCFEIEPDVGVRVSKIVNLSDDIKLNLAATDIRIEAPIPGKNAVGIEIPNKVKTPVTFREMIESKEFKTHKSKVAVAVGKDITGKPIIGDIAKMPHILIAGTTGSGKSVCTSGLIMSILYHATPAEVRLIMIDPKVVEYTKFNGIPHLLMPVVTDAKHASAVLQGAVNEMTKRFQWFADAKVVDLDGYNAYRKEMGMEPLPRIVIFIDELADLMMAASKEVEDSICRIAQLARACGMHLVIATQRPSVNVVTGLIKANLPSRLALKVSNGVDSRTILDATGAESLLGYGDMLYKPQDYQKAVRLQGCYIDADAQKRVVEWILKNNDGMVEDENIKIAVQSAEENSTKIDGRASAASAEAEDNGDPLLLEAAKLIIANERGSVGFLQKKLKIGFNRGSRIMDELWERGIVGPEEGTKPRRILVTVEEAEKILSENTAN